MANSPYVLLRHERERCASGNALSFIDSLNPAALRRYARLLSIDERTGLLSRDAFVHSVAGDAPDAFPLPMLVYDIVGLKELNNQGRWLGDTAIAVSGKLIRAATSEGYRAARLGGDEFGILPPVTAGGIGDAFLLHARDRLEDAMVRANEHLRTRTGMQDFLLKVRYGIVLVREPTADAVYDAIGEATKRAYQEIPATPREKTLYA